MMSRWKSYTLLLIACTTVTVSGEPAPSKETPAEQRHSYYTHGVHNDVGCDPPERCLAKRLPGEPSDPALPQWWISDWTMYRVFDGYETYPPPYDSPPRGLTPEDYEVSYGRSYYDATYVPSDGDGRGAMMEHYEKRCLPIFPTSNHYTCSFLSLGNKTYFLRYDDRPKGTPACCIFSKHNHPPRQDFIKHLPYNAKESQHLDGRIQAYSFRLDSQGADVLFGYAFYKNAEPDSYDSDAEPYRHPQSFYFSGFPMNPPNAPIVSQNYKNFRMERPIADETWDRVAQMCPANPPWCCLFSGDCPEVQMTGEQTPANWSTLEPPHKTQN